MGLPPSPRCVITGAGSGFGRAIAIELGRLRARLLVSDVNLPATEETAHAAAAAGAVSVRAARCDVTRLEDVEALPMAAGEPTDLLVNNAGVASAGRIGDLSIEDWRSTLDVNLNGVIHGCHVFVPRLRAQGHGHLLNVASAAGLVSFPYMGAYNVTKAGVVALSETLAAELHGSGVGVTVLCPTFFRTDIVKNGRFSDAQSRRFAEERLARGPAAETVARAALASVNRKELYAVPMSDGRWLWRVKRFTPSTFVALVGWIAQRMRGDSDEAEGRGRAP
jgi:NAD(P)-dependent dehydrogenase (short-subunit alcohol dehydrogenase family)